MYYLCTNRINKQNSYTFLYMKKTGYILFLCLLVLTGQAQIKWFNPMDAGYPVVQNQGFTAEIGETYTRLPERAKNVVREPVWNLSQNSAGLMLDFYTNAQQIHIRYQVTGALNMPHMPTLGVSGLDLYRISKDGEAQFCFGHYAFGDTITYSYQLNKEKTHHDLGNEFRLYLPLYNGVKWLEIGIPEDRSLRFAPVSAEKPIVVYGTSIAQGACASRPGMAWTTILQRSLEYPLINLGFSGNGRLEPEVIDFLNENDARLYILDCMPNLLNRSEEEVTSLLIQAVKQIRDKHQTPILLVEHAGNSNALTEAERTAENRTYQQTNAASQKAFAALQAENIPGIYYLSAEDLNFPSDGWVDYVHPSDLGMQVQADAVENMVRQILQIPFGPASTMQPVIQRREPDKYEWNERHQAFLEAVQTNQPKAVILGNSITHYWSGEPEHRDKNGKEAWDAVMRPAGFQNLGCGWDRVENVLWRVYHGELDGYSADKVVVMIGTNNMGLNSDEEIVNGLEFLLQAIQVRQPDAKIKMIGILPRRDNEAWVKAINQSIRTMTEKNGYTFTDVGDAFLLPDGTIDETLFVGDGLHPNNKGYEKIARQIAE